MAGIQEILTLILIIVGIVLLPRTFSKKKKTTTIKKKPDPFSGKIRLGIVLSILIPVISALVLKPWHQDLTLFIFLGILPVAAGWSGFWIISGFKKNRQ